MQNLSIYRIQQLKHFNQIMWTQIFMTSLPLTILIFVHVNRLSHSNVNLVSFFLLRYSQNTRLTIFRIEKIVKILVLQRFSSCCFIMAKNLSLKVCLYCHIETTCGKLGRIVNSKLFNAKKSKPRILAPLVSKLISILNFVI